MLITLGISIRIKFYKKYLIKYPSEFIKAINIYSKSLAHFIKVDFKMYYYCLLGYLFIHL